MSSFKFYEYNQSGLIDRVHEVRLAGLDRAQEYAAGLGSHRAVDIWIGQRQVGSVPPRRAR